MIELIGKKNTSKILDKSDEKYQEKTEENQR
jgi:hypothetical protein